MSNYRHNVTSKLQEPVTINQNYNKDTSFDDPITIQIQKRKNQVVQDISAAQSSNDYNYHVPITQQEGEINLDSIHSKLEGMRNEIKRQMVVNSHKFN